MKKGLYALLAVVLLAAAVLGVLLFQAKGDIAGLVSEVGTLNSAIEGKDREIAELTADTTDKSEQIKALTSDTEEKGAAIEALQTEAQEKDSAIETLNSEAAEKAAEIEALKAEGAEKDAAIEALSADVEERDASLESLKAEAAEKEEQIGDLTAEAAEKNEQIEAMNAEAAEKDAQIEALAAQAAEKDAQIADLSSRLEQAEASLPKEDDLSWIKEGRYINTKRFLAFLEDNEIWYDVKTSDSDESSDQIFFYDLTFTSQSGVDFPVDCTVYMSSNNDRISVVIYDLIAFDANNIGQVKDVLADLNAYCLWVKFYVEDDDTVTAAIDCPVTDSPEMVDVFVASLGHTFDVIEEVYDYLAPYNIQ